RMGYIDGQLVVNPKLSDMEGSDLDLVVAGTSDAILMVEAGARGGSGQGVIGAPELGHTHIAAICNALLGLRRTAGKPNADFAPPRYDPDMVAAVAEVIGSRLDEVAYDPDKTERENRLSALKKEMKEALLPRWPESGDVLGTLFEKKLKDRVR